MSTEQIRTVISLMDGFSIFLVASDNELVRNVIVTILVTLDIQVMKLV